ncbi:hypothetical protein [Epibacterium ulvae]|uniref:Uncharacterized protein n=1 Tax=Epibacterium ulvae TaxID=1156985 RepID=A0A1G5R184_9RHOB|nr:hypothetical protein [Epibacterium ulvae]SCZ67706.1 hypothetical protein SAMN04488118_107101 [Epibacterium ulvae]
MQNPHTANRLHPQRRAAPQPEQRRLTQEEKDQVGDWVASKATNSNCPVCDHNSWAVGDYLVQNPAYVPGSSKPGRASYPAAMLMCSHCAYLRLFMAAPMGLLD